MNTDDIVTKIHSRIHDLDKGDHEPTSGSACVMELVSWANGEPWTSFPECVPKDVAQLCQVIHDQAKPAEYATLWSRDRLHRILSADRKHEAIAERAFMAAEYARRRAVTIMRERGMDTTGIDACADVTSEDTAFALATAMRDAYTYQAVTARIASTCTALNYAAVSASFAAKAAKTYVFRSTSLAWAAHQSFSAAQAATFGLPDGPIGRGHTTELLDLWIGMDTQPQTGDAQ